MLILAAQHLIFTLGWPEGRSGGDGHHQIKIWGVRAHTSIWAGSWHTRGVAGVLGLLIPLFFWRAPQGYLLLCSEVQGRADIS